MQDEPQNETQDAEQAAPSAMSPVTQIGLDRWRMHAQRIRDWTNEAIIAHNAGDTGAVGDRLAYICSQAAMLVGRMTEAGAKAPSRPTDAPRIKPPPYDTPLYREYAQALARAGELAAALDRERYGPDCEPDGPNSTLVGVLLLAANMDMNPPATGSG